jgi:TonB family protein
MAARRGEFSARVAALLDAQRPRRKIGRAGKTVAVVVSLGLAVALSPLIAAQAALTALPQFVRVEGASSVNPAAAVPLPPIMSAPSRVSSSAKAPQRTRIGARPIASSSVTPPQLITSFPPTYTIQGWSRLVEGTVTLEVSVDERGNATVLRTVSGLGYGLDEKAAEAVRGWKFIPALRNGVPVSAITQIDVDFDASNGPRTLRLTDTAGMGVSPPVVVSHVEPQYPEEALKENIQGRVLLEVIVRKDGACEVLRVLTSRGPSLDQAAIEALKQWRFEPGTRNGRPIDLALNVFVYFSAPSQTALSQIVFERQ